MDPALMAITPPDTPWTTWIGIVADAIVEFCAYVWTNFCWSFVYSMPADAATFAEVTVLAGSVTVPLNRMVPVYWRSPSIRLPMG
jgi:hypothetical protein